VGARIGAGLVAASFVLALGACASLVGADFDSAHGPLETDGGVIVPPTVDGRAPTSEDSSGNGVDAHVTPTDGGVCPPRFLDCGGLCFDISTSPDHCGSCSTTCKGDPHGAAVCVASHCELACNDGYSQCAAGCCAVGTSDAGGSDSGDDAGDDGGADSGPPPAAFTCGSMSCLSGQTFCCGDGHSPGGQPIGDVCLPTQNDTSGDSCPYVFACAATDDCKGPGGVCCYDPSTDTQDPSYQSSFCASDCNGGNGLYVQLCDPAANDCPGGSSCSGAVNGQGLSTTFMYCQ
jgi:hypothetical protein